MKKLITILTVLVLGFTAFALPLKKGFYVDGCDGPLYVEIEADTDTKGLKDYEEILDCAKCEFDNWYKLTKLEEPKTRVDYGVESDWRMMIVRANKYKNVKEVPRDRDLFEIHFAEYLAFVLNCSDFKDWMNKYKLVQVRIIGGENGPIYQLELLKNNTYAWFIIGY